MPGPQQACLDNSNCRTLDDWAYIVIDDTTYPCSARHLGLDTAWIDNVVVAVGERLKLYVHLEDGAGGLMFLRLSGQVSWTNGHRAEIALTRIDEDTQRALEAWVSARVLRSILD